MLIEALKRAGIEDGMSVQEIADRLEIHLSPKAEPVSKNGTEVRMYITSSVDAGLFCGVTTGNPEIQKYLFPDGKQSGLVRFGQCDRLVGEALGEQLLSIVKISFTREVLIGETVCLVIKLGTPEESSRPKGMIRTSTITGTRLSDGKQVMEPSQVITFFPKPKPPVRPRNRIVSEDFDYPDNASSS